MSSSSVVTLVNLTLTTIEGAFTYLLPLIIPFAVATAIFFGIWFWIRGTARRRV